MTRTDVYDTGSLTNRSMSLGRQVKASLGFSVFFCLLQPKFTLISIKHQSNYNSEGIENPMVWFISSSVKYSKSLNFRKFFLNTSCRDRKAHLPVSSYVPPGPQPAPRGSSSQGKWSVSRKPPGQNHWRKAPHSVFFPLRGTLPHYSSQRLASLCLNMVSGELSPPHNATEFFICGCLQRRVLSSELPRCYGSSARYRITPRIKEAPWHRDSIDLALL